MSLDADTLLDRMQLKQQLLRWRSFAILLLTALALLLVHRSIDVTDISQPEYIASISIDGLITVDDRMVALIDRIREDKNARAVLVDINSQGGTAIGGEELYLALKRLREEKPVVILMRTLCTSAGYLTALGGDHLLARKGTLTGSIGVIIQSFEATELAESIGIEPIIVRSGDLKAVPNPLEKIEPEQRAFVKSVVEDFYAFFLAIVKDERELSDASLKLITDGRVFTGSQAVEVGLVDAIGGKREALEWLEANHNIDKETRIRKLEPDYEKASLFGRLNQAASKALQKAENLPLTLDGLLLIWQPSQIK